MKLVILEGNIGAGKSTVLEELQKLSSKKLRILQEPVDVWTNYKGTDNLLAMHYENPLDYAFKFQILVLITLGNLIKNLETNTDEIVVIERSIFSARYCFIERLYINKLISELEYSILDDLFATIINTWSLGQVEEIIVYYLECSEKTCQERITKRNRPGEKIGTRLLTELNDMFNNIFVTSMQSTFKDIIFKRLSSDDNSAKSIAEIINCEI